ncbi:hypothetical protein EBU24_05165 [bacterium]|nr:hypothetical protein [bacterium]
MNYKKNRCKPSLLSCFFLCFGFYLLTQLRVEYIATRPETNSWQTLKTATGTVALHGISVLSAGMINIGTQLARIKNKLNNNVLPETSEQTLPHEQPTAQDVVNHQENLTHDAQEIHKKIFATQENQDNKKLTTHNNHEEKAQQEEESKEEAHAAADVSTTKPAINPLDPSAFAYIDTLEDQLTSAQKYILREEAVDYSDHTINVLSEEIKSLKSYAHYIETEYGNEHHKEVFHRKLLTLVNKSEQLLTAITEELTGVNQAFQPSTSIDAGIEYNKTILAQLRTQLS